MDIQNQLLLVNVQRLLELINTRIVILDHAEVAFMEAAASMLMNPLFRDASPEGLIPAMNMMENIQSALQETWRYGLKDASGKEPRTGMTVKVNSSEIIIVQAYGPQAFKLVEFRPGTTFKVKSVGQTKLSKETPGSDPQYVFLTECGNMLPLDWKFFSLV